MNKGKKVYTIEEQEIMIAAANLLVQRHMSVEKVARIINVPSSTVWWWMRNVLADIDYPLERLTDEALVARRKCPPELLRRSM